MLLQGDPWTPGELGRGGAHWVGFTLPWGRQVRLDRRWACWGGKDSPCAQASTCQVPPGAVS